MIKGKEMVVQPLPAREYRPSRPVALPADRCRLARIGG